MIRAVGLLNLLRVINYNTDTSSTVIKSYVTSLLSREQIRRHDSVLTRTSDLADFRCSLCI